MMNTNSMQKGAVSLFVVIFSTLLITVVVLSFLRLMLAEQQRAVTNDLSQSAYDSALAGVEDAKRALLRYQTICNGSDDAACADAKALVATAGCNQGLAGIVDISGPEVKIQQTSGDVSLDQAYTCVKIALQTIDYLGTLESGASKIIPLFGTSSFSTIQVEWFSPDDLSTTTTDGGDFTVDLLSAASVSYPLIAQSNWPANRPAIMRTQLMQFGSQFSLSDFDTTNAASESNANTLFLYPVGTTGQATAALNAYSFAGRDVRKTPIGSPLGITCSGTLESGGYACKTTIDLPTPIGGGQRTAYLRLSALYNASHFRVSLLNGTTVIPFDAVQPEVDSTGRANDLFRRVKNRVDLIDTNFAFPEAAVDITGNFCKDFLVTTNAADYQENCTP